MEKDGIVIEREKGRDTRKRQTSSWDFINEQCRALCIAAIIRSLKIKREWERERKRSSRGAFELRIGALSLRINFCVLPLVQKGPDLRELGARSHRGPRLGRIKEKSVVIQTTRIPAKYAIYCGAKGLQLYFLWFP